MIADLITVSRALFSLCLLALPISPLFWILYFLCGVSDVLDGFLARKLHTESAKGARLDSASDLLFALVYAVRILPRLHLSLPLWLWIGGIAVLKGLGIALASRRERGLCVRHSSLNRLTGVLVFLLPLLNSTGFIRPAAVLVCLAATAAAPEDLRKSH